MIKLNLYWKRDGKDVGLGICYHPVVPPVGGLFTFSCDHGHIWKVRLHYQHMVMEGSQTHRAWSEGRPSEAPGVTLFVEPADGPFEP